jgi:anhydro-N-acetylmuramic acid kinase
MHDKIYIGLMSGTSLDAIDCVLTSFGKAQTNRAVTLLATHSHPFPETTHAQLLQLISKPEEIIPAELGPLDNELGHIYAAAVNALLEEAGYRKEQITAIGNHGQTVLHKPDADPGFSLQLGNGEIIANETGITTVVDFRTADIALGGQGAPLVPGFHQHVFGQSDRTRIILNIGGIANITVLGSNGVVSGFDTGPGNTLLDMWTNEHTGERFDADGAWAASGTPLPALLNKLLADAYFQTPPPKSTGREHFNLAWLKPYLNEVEAQAADVQATLTELTAQTIATAIRQQTSAAEVLVCGGGTENAYLMQALTRHLSGITVTPMPPTILPPEWVEAAAFAWLARARLRNEPAGLPQVTGASAPALLGRVCVPAEA